MKQSSLSILLLNHSWFQPELTKLGHRVVSAGSGSGRYDVRFTFGASSWDDVKKRLPKGFTPARVVYYDDSLSPGLFGLEDLDVPSVFYSIDTHHHHNWHKHFASLFDRVLTAQRDYSHYFDSPTQSGTWLPLWATVTRDPDTEKPVDACFRGTFDETLHPERRKFFDALGSLIPINAKSGHFEAPYCKSKIVVNETVKDDLNFRVFEALACGALLVTPEVGNGLLELFTPNEDLVTFKRGDARDAAEKIRFFLDNDAERERIASNGFRKVRALHTSEVRAKQLEQILLQTEKTSSPLRLYNAALSYFVGAQVLRDFTEPCSKGLLVEYLHTSEAKHQ